MSFASLSRYGSTRSWLADGTVKSTRSMPPASSASTLARSGAAPWIVTVTESGRRPAAANRWRRSCRPVRAAQLPSRSARRGPRRGRHPVERTGHLQGWRRRSAVRAAGLWLRREKPARSQHLGPSNHQALLDRGHVRPPRQVLATGGREHRGQTGPETAPADLLACPESEIHGA